MPTDDDSTIISELIPPKARAVLYVLTGMLAPFYVVAANAVDLAWYWVGAYASWNGLVAVVAAANTNRPAKNAKADVVHVEGGA